MKEEEEVKEGGEEEDSCPGSTQATVTTIFRHMLLCYFKNTLFVRNISFGSLLLNFVACSSSLKSFSLTQFI